MKKNAILTLVPMIALGFGFVFSAAATPGHGYVSIPAVAFQPQREIFPYATNGKEIFNPLGYGMAYLAPVLLPHGVTVTKVTFYFYDNSSESDDYGDAVLGRHDNAGNLQGMANIHTNDNGNSSSFDDSIDYPSIDNSQYSYYLSLYLGSGDVHAYAVIIEYTTPASINLPLISK